MKSNLVNNFHWGYTRQSLGQIGNQTQPFVQFRGLNDNSTTNNSSFSEFPTTTFQVPVHNFLDDVSWIKGNHTFTFGTNVDIMRNPQSTNIASFSTAVTNARGSRRPAWQTPVALLIPPRLACRRSRVLSATTTTIH